MIVMEVLKQVMKAAQEDLAARKKLKLKRCVSIFTNKSRTACNVKTQQLSSLLSSSSEECPDEDESKNSDDNCEKNTSHDLACDTGQQQSAVADTSTIATLLRRLKEAEETNNRLQTQLKKERSSLSPSLSSSGIESLIDSADKENIRANFENRASSSTFVSTNARKNHLKKRNENEQIKQNETESKTLEKNSYKDLYEDSEIIFEQEPAENIVQNLQKSLPDAPRQLRQLYGKDFNENGETMVLLGSNVFCKPLVLHYALGSSTKTTHLVRKLVLGVFKTEIFKKGLCQVTLTGNAPRSLGKQLGAKYYNIDICARSAIIKYAKVIGKLKNWPYVHTKDLNRILSQRIGELKREYSTDTQINLN